MMDPNRYIVEAALVRGWPAQALSVFIPRYCREAIAELPPELRADLNETIAAIGAAGASWMASGRGIVELPIQLPSVESQYEHDEITTTAAAAELCISGRRVRQLCEQGRLPARRVGGRWLVSRAAVQARLERRVM
jgi:excisionase family DNA binding protein